jgi:hypothetical protein
MRNVEGNDVIDKVLLLTHHLLYHLNLPILLMPLHLNHPLLNLIITNSMLNFIIISKISTMKLSRWKINDFINLERR